MIHHFIRCSWVSLRDLIGRAFNLDRIAISKLITMIEDSPESAEFIKELWGGEVKSHVVGITGSPGVGKSTLISALVDELTQNNCLVAILALDPASPISRGSLLGDRVRMHDIRNMDRVFIRSMSVLPGESMPLKAVLAIELFNAIGFNYVIIETPGVGQINVEVSNVADTTVLVLMPGSGDEIQALKAGIMEVCDIYVINKSDMPGADIAFNQLLFALGDELRDGWVPRIVKTSALTKAGINELIKALEDHRDYLVHSGKYKSKTALRRALELELAIKYKVLSIIKESMESVEPVKEIYKEVVEGHLNPITAADKVIKLLMR